MDLTLTISLTAAFAALGGFAAWRGARPPNPHRGPRMVPWRFLMMLAAAGELMMLVHLINLFGVTTGHQ